MTHSTNPTFAPRGIARRMFTALMATSLFLMFAVSLHAQNYSTDARRVGMGAIGGNESEADHLAGDTRQYRAIGVPLGLFQFPDTKIFKPEDDQFDPVRAMEYAISPMHLTFNRDSGGPGQKLISDLVNSHFSTDLNAYKGFTPAQTIDALGLLAPNWGKTFKIRKHGDSYDGFYVGAGPYISVGTNLAFDQRLIDFLSNPNAPSPANTTYLITDSTGIQGAGAITGGYRARLPYLLTGSSSGKAGRNGIFVAADFNYLRGFHYENADIDVQVETDSTGKVTVTPSSKPIVIDRIWSERGHGYSIDLSTAVVRDKWNAGVSVEGIGNRIDWENLDAERHELVNLTTGADFQTTSITAPVGNLRVKLPVRYSMNAGYQFGGALAVAEYRHGLQKDEFHGGAEYPFMFLEFRGGLRYTRPDWNPTAGLGFNLGKRIGIDVAAFGTTANIERDRKVAMALSLRINAKEQ